MNIRTAFFALLMVILVSVVFAGSMSVSGEGTLVEAGVTTFQYGTHLLMDEDGRILFALRSVIVNLDDYVDRQVAVEGLLVDGYPVDGGPAYLEVSRVQTLD